MDNKLFHAKVHQLDLMLMHERDAKRRRNRIKTRYWKQQKAKMIIENPHSTVVECKRARRLYIKAKARNKQELNRDKRYRN